MGDDGIKRQSDEGHWEEINQRMPQPPPSTIEEPKNLKAGNAQTDRNAKAVKADDAEVYKHLWDERVMLGLPGRKYNDKSRKALESMQKLGIRFWKQRVTNSFLDHMNREHGDDWARPARYKDWVYRSEMRKDLVAGLDALQRAWRSDKQIAGTASRL